MVEEFSSLPLFFCIAYSHTFVLFALPSQRFEWIWNQTANTLLTIHWNNALQKWSHWMSTPHRHTHIYIYNTSTLWAARGKWNEKSVAVLPEVRICIISDHNELEYPMKVSRMLSALWERMWIAVSFIPVPSVSHTCAGKIDWDFIMEIFFSDFFIWKKKCWWNVSPLFYL